MSGSAVVALTLVLPFLGALLIGLLGRAIALRDGIVLLVPLALP